MSAYFAAAKDKQEQVSALEKEMDEAAAKLWGITSHELKAIQNALQEVSSSKTETEEEEEDA